MKIFTGKRIALGLIVILVIVAFFGYKNKEYIQQLPIGCAFKTKALCAAVFVSGRDPVTIEQEDIGFSPLFKLYRAKIDRVEKSVTCSLKEAEQAMAQALKVEVGDQTDGIVKVCALHG